MQSNGLFTLVVIDTYALCSAFEKLHTTQSETKAYGFGEKIFIERRFRTMNAFPTMYCDKKKKCNR